MEIDVCPWAPLPFYPISVSSGILPVFLLASLNLSIYHSISQVSNICSQHQPFHYWNSQPRPFELNHLLVLNIAQATQLHNSISSAHRYVFLKQYVKYMSFMSNIDNDCDDCNDCGLCKEKLFLFKYLWFCFEEIFMCVLNNSQNFLRERKIPSIINFYHPRCLCFHLRVDLV